MKIKYTTYFLRRFKHKVHKQPQLKQTFKKQIRLLQQDIRHPALKVHKLKGRRAVESAFWIEGNLRITFIIYATYYILTDIITHDEY